MLERALREQGIDVACDARPRRSTRIASSSHRREIEADLVIVAAGVVPEAGLARRMGVEVDRGVLVDDSLRTNAPASGPWASAPSIAGCSSASSRPRWRWPAPPRADIAGAPAAYLPGRAATRLKVAGIDLFCSGELEGDDEVVALDTRAATTARGLPRRRARRARSCSATRRRTATPRRTS